MNFKRLVGLALFFIVFPSSAFAVITVKKVELKDSKGEWMTLIEPDRSVDPCQGELGLTFVNGGRVAEGEYLNFRMTLSEFADRRSKEEDHLILLRSDLVRPLSIRRGSFIGVWFHLSWKGSVAQSELKDAEVTVDQTTQTIHDIEMIRA